MLVELAKAADVEVKISEEKQMETITKAIEVFEGILANSSLDSADKTGVEKAIVFLNDAYNALVSYQR